MFFWSKSHNSTFQLYYEEETSKAEEKLAQESKQRVICIYISRLDFQSQERKNSLKENGEQKLILEKIFNLERSKSQNNEELKNAMTELKNRLKSYRIIIARYGTELDSDFGKRIARDS